MGTQSKKIITPIGWKSLALSDVAQKIIGGGTPSRGEPKYWGGNIPWVTVKDLTKRRYIDDAQESITEVGLKESASNLMPAKSIITATRMAVGRFYINKIPVAINQDLKALIISNGFDTDFVYWALASKSSYLASLGTGTTVKGIKLDTLRALRLLVPSLIDEQKKIAEILGEVDEEIQKTDEVISATEKLKKGLMQQLFTRGIGHEKFKKTKIGKIPREWDVKTFEEFSVLQRGFDLPVQNRIVGQYDLVTSNGITDKHGQFKVKAPGVVTGRSGTLGKVFYIKSDFWPLNTTLYIKNFHGNHEKFVYYKIQSFDIARFGTGTGVPTLNRNNVHKELIAVPRYSEQKEIAETLSSVDEKIAVNKELKAKLILLKKGLMQDLLSGRVRVNICGK